MMESEARLDVQNDLLATIEEDRSSTTKIAMALAEAMLRVEGGQQKAAAESLAPPPPLAPPGGLSLQQLLTSVETARFVFEAAHRTTKSAKLCPELAPLQ